MNDEIQFLKDSTRESMDGAVKHLTSELQKIRAGKASPAMVESVVVEYYGSHMPISQVSNVNTPDGRTITIQPWEKNMLEVIERAIIASNIGLNPQNNGDIIIINVPSLTEERRQSLVKQAKSEAENARISIRSARKEAHDEIKKLEKEHLPEDLSRKLDLDIQKLTDDYSKKVDEVLAKKEKDIMTV